MYVLPNNENERRAIDKAHKERGKVIGEVWRWMTRRT